MFTPALPAAGKRLLLISLAQTLIRSAVAGSSCRTYLSQSVADPLLGQEGEVMHIGLGLHHCFVLVDSILVPERQHQCG